MLAMMIILATYALVTKDHQLGAQPKVSFLWICSIVATATAALRLYQLELSRTYRYFFGYLLVNIARSVGLLLFTARSDTYTIIDSVTFTIWWIFHILIVLELFSLVLQGYSGIYSLSRMTLYGGMLISTLVSMLASTFWGGGTVRLRPWTAIEHGVMFTLLIFMLLILTFLFRYPVSLNRNLVVHCILYAVFFMSTSVISLISDYVNGNCAQNLNVALMVIGTTCYIVWAIVFTCAGESQMMTLCKEPVLKRRADA